MVEFVLARIYAATSEEYARSYLDLRGLDGPESYGPEMLDSTCDIESILDPTTSRSATPPRCHISNNEEARPTSRQHLLESIPSLFWECFP